MSEEKDKPVFDEQLLTNLLEAAYVLQEHNRELQAMEMHVEPQELEALAEPSFPAAADGKAPAGQTSKDTLTLGQIVETQHQIQVRRLELESALALVAERVTEIAHAVGAAIGILDGRKVRYKAVFGLKAPSASAEVPMEKALCVACLRTGQVIRCADVNPEFLLDTEECHRRGIQAMIAVPVYHDGGIAGGLEVYYGSTQAFSEQDVHTVQLMAGLVTEALARDEELTWKQSLATERAAMMDALAKLKPNLVSLANGSARKDPAMRAVPASSGTTFVCRVCGNELASGEQFCGKCGAPRGASHEPLPVPVKLAPPSPAAQALKSEELADPVNISPAHQEKWEHDSENKNQDPADSIEDEDVLSLLAKSERPGTAEDALTSPTEELEAGMQIMPEPSDGIETPSAEEGKLVKPGLGAWTSAATTRAYLEQLALAPRPGALTRFWSARRGDFYLAIAVLLVACVIRWGIWSDGSVSATGSPGITTSAANRKPAPDADLSLFDRMLISFGLADAPEPQENKGNPDTRVWVDLHTALYYCPGADLYGKTPKGKFTTQREAQLDQFEPASRKACD